MAKETEDKITMKKGLLIAILTTLACMVRADGIKNIDDYCRQIDEAIEHSGDYVAAHEKQKAGRLDHGNGEESRA